MSRLQTVRENWTDITTKLLRDKQALAHFLRFSAKMYKQSFSDAVLIYQQKSDITAEWTCTNANATFTDSAALLTTVSFAETGSFDIVCTVTDGENTVTAIKTVTVEPSDSYADIDPDKQEAPAPEIEVVLPEYADRKQVINAKIEKLNDTEISWYSVIFNGNTAVNVDDEGNFTLTMPNKDGEFPVVVRAFDWSGNLHL